MDGKSGPLLYRGLPERKNTDSAGNKGYDRARRCPESSATSLQITTANVTDRAGLGDV